MKASSFGLVGLGLALAVLPACSAIVGIKDLPSDEGTSSGGGGSGGGSGGSGSDKTTRFVGTWNLTTGSNTTTCNGVPTVSTDSGTLRIVRGTSSDLVFTPPNGCSLMANVTSANVATLVNGQSCSGVTSDGIDVVFFPSGTFQIDSNATSGVVSISGTADASQSGQTEECPFTQQDNYARAP